MKSPLLGGLSILSNFLSKVFALLPRLGDSVCPKQQSETWSMNKYLRKNITSKFLEVNYLSNFKQSISKRKSFSTEPAYKHNGENPVWLMLYSDLVYKPYWISKLYN